MTPVFVKGGLWKESQTESEKTDNMYSWGLLEHATGIFDADAKQKRKEKWDWVGKYENNMRMKGEGHEGEVLKLMFSLFPQRYLGW